MTSLASSERSLAAAGVSQGRMTVGDVVALHAANPALRDRLAVSCGEARRSWAQLDERATSLARGLAGLGLARGDAVGVYMRNRIEFVEAMYGLGKLGAALIPLSPRFTAAEVEHGLRACEAAAVLTDADGIDAARAAAGEVGIVDQRLIVVGDERAADRTRYEALVSAGARDDRELATPDESDTFRLALTSGTTGPPKACVVPHRASVQSWAEQSVAFGMTSADSELTVGPMFHGLGFSGALQTLYAGGTVRVMERFDADAALDEIAATRPTVIRGVPVMYERIMAALERRGRDLSSLRLVMTTGAPMAPDRKRALARAFGHATVIEFLASTEGGLYTAHRLDPDSPEIASCGRPYFRTRIRILDEQGESLPAGEVGEICKLGLLQGASYFRDPERTAASFFGEWFRSGDLGYQDADGNVFVVGRSKDVIVSGGINVYPAEIEGVIRELDDVTDVAVTGVPDERWGEAVKAVVVRRDGARCPTPASVAQACRERLAGYKQPRLIEFAPELPHTASGKVLKRELRARRGYELRDSEWRPIG